MISILLKMLAFQEWHRSCLIGNSVRKEFTMLYYALVFLLIALMAGILGFGVVAFAAAEVARICFFIFLVLFVLSLIGHVRRRPLP